MSTVVSLFMPLFAPYTSNRFTAVKLPLHRRSVRVLAAVSMRPNSSSSAAASASSRPQLSRAYSGLVLYPRNILEPPVVNSGALQYRALPTLMSLEALSALSPKAPPFWEVRQTEAITPLPCEVVKSYTKLATPLA